MIGTGLLVSSTRFGKLMPLQHSAPTGMLCRGANTNYNLVMLEVEEREFSGQLSEPHRGDGQMPNVWYILGTMRPASLKS